MVLSKDIKIAICFGLIMGALISICNLCFAAEIEDVSISVVNNVGFSATSETFISSSYNCAYFEVEPGYSYTIVNTTSGNNPRLLAFSNSVPSVGADCFYVTTINSGNSYTFNSSQFGYIYCDVFNTGGFEVTRTELFGLTGFVDSLAYDLSYANLSGVMFFVVPIMAIAILFGLGFYLLKRLLNKIKRAKGGA